MAGSLPVQKRVKASVAQQTKQTMMFPNDLSTHGMLFMFQKYSYSAAKSSVAPSMSAASTDSIILPLPMSLEDRMSVTMNASSLHNSGDLMAQGAEMMNKNVGQGGSMGDVVGGTVGAIMHGMKGILPNPQDAANMFRSVMSGANLPGETSNLVNYLTRLGIDKFGPSAWGNAFEAGTGTTFNPKQALLFENVPLKRHDWTWNLVPRSSSESESIRRIVDTFRIHSLPGTANINDVRKYMLTYPSIMNVVLMGVDPAHFLVYKPMMIETINVNYAPNGVSILAGGKPASISLTVTCVETDMWTRNDITGDDSIQHQDDVTDFVTKIQSVL